MFDNCISVPPVENSDKESSDQDDKRSVNGDKDPKQVIDSIFALRPGNHIVCCVADSCNPAGHVLSRHEPHKVDQEK